MVEEWWTEDQKEMVLDKSRIWIKQKFHATGGYWIIQDGHKILGKLSNAEILPPAAVIDNSAWDHEHCGLCWQKISEKDGDQQEGYTHGREWVCVECYSKYIQPGT